MSGPAVAGLEGRLGYVISVPQSWYELELRPGVRDQAIPRLVEERVRGNEELWAQRRGIEKLLLEHAARAWDSGATYAAGFSLPTEEGPVTGSLTVTLVEDPAGEVVLAPEERFRQVPRTGDLLAPYAHTSMVDIPRIGACPRSSGIDDAPAPDGGLIRHVFMVTAVPVPEHRRTFLISASSPVLALADALLDLFDAVTSTFRVVPLDEPSPTTPQEELVDVQAD
ncbi:hypothetical protein [Nocardioides pantholopis]|uniref:hypothetical protein n=1 Tax=Nocardioides pantholopis TaxID=2483798 RepID=UPI000FD7296F|nr:hypothetical protein [Nocardioides pantholopis]